MKRQSIKLKVKTEKREFNIEWEQRKSLIEVLQKEHLFLPHSCHGNGTCGKCKVKILSGNLPITETERRMLSEEELEQGIRLACKVKPESWEEAGTQEEISIELEEGNDEDIIIEGSSLLEKRRSSKTELCAKKTKQKAQSNLEAADCFIAVDIGTTTIAMALVEEETGEIRDMFFSINHQRKFGADVISRIKAANEKNAEELKQLIENDLWQGICKLTEGKKEALPTDLTGIKMEKETSEINLTKIVIAGNTTMVHLLMGYSCESLGKYPFVSKHLKQVECYLKECFAFHFDDKFQEIQVTILPGISTFVGGDIVAGLLCCPGFETEELCLLIDLGTNGEMVLGNKNRLLTASAAAGPAFEGGNIVCGMAGIPGSICQVKIQNQRAVVKTIKTKMPPVGICGSGLVSVMAQLKQHKIIDEFGGFRYPYNKQGYPLWTFENGEKIAIYQQDIREFQKAKSAIRAGIEILMEEYGCKESDISRVYLAGGFGTHLSKEDAILTGILPPTFGEKTEAIGNSALKGAICYGLKRKNRIKNEEYFNDCFEDKRCMNEKMYEIVQKSESISLAENEKFQELYLENMGF